MIRKFRTEDIDNIMQIWLDTNIKTHNFIQKQYWTDHYARVKNLLPRAEIYVYETNNTKQATGFIGLD